jgi:hypothetical protein
MKNLNEKVWIFFMEVLQGNEGATVRGIEFSRSVQDAVDALLCQGRHYRGRARSRGGRHGLRISLPRPRVSRQTAQRALNWSRPGCFPGPAKARGATLSGIPYRGIVSFQLLTQRVSLEKKRIEQMGEISLKLITNLRRCRLRLFCGCFDDLHVRPFSPAECNERCLTTPALGRG